MAYRTRVREFLVRCILIVLFLVGALFLSHCSPRSSPAEVTSLPSPLATFSPVTTLDPSPSHTSLATNTASPTVTLTPTSTATPFSIPIISDHAIRWGNPDHPYVALTFDVEAAYSYTIPILETLRQYGVQATFFITGEFARKHPKLVWLIAQEGHEIGNHTDTHPYLTDLSDEEVLQELRRAEAILIEVSGLSPQPYFRPTYAKWDTRIKQLAAQEGYLTIAWTVDVVDWNGINTGDSMVQRALDGAKNGAIIVLHIDERAPLALPRIIAGLRAKGYELVGLTQLLAP